MGLGPAGALRMRVIVLDPNQRVAATFDSRALPAAAEAMDGLARSVRSDGGRELLLKTPMAPVLVLPRVFEPDFCTQLVRLWGKGDHKDSGVSSRYGNINMDHLKRTEDYTIVEPMMLKAISDRLAYRIGPELTKVFAFDRAVHLRFAHRAVLQRRRQSTSSAPIATTARRPRPIAPSPCRSTSTTISRAASWSSPNMPACA